MLQVMNVYPGLVAICTFANFRRQLRAYNFDWYVNDKGQIEFAHHYFLRGHPELVSQILTKRYMEKFFHRLQVDLQTL